MQRILLLAVAIALLFEIAPIGADAPSSNVLCFGVSNSSATVCNGRGTCSATDRCDCSSNTYIGSQCEVNITSSSTSFYSLNMASLFAKANTSMSAYLPSYTITPSVTGTTEALVSTTFTNVGERRGVCLNPTISIATSQVFVAFRVPTLPVGASTEVWLVNEAGKVVLSSAVVYNTTGGQKLKVTSDTAESSTDVKLWNNSTYYLVLSAYGGATVNSQIVDKKNTVLAWTNATVGGSNVTSSILNDQFLVCASLTNIGVSRSIRAVSGTASVTFYFYGNQPIGTIGSLTKPKVLPSMILVLAAVLGCILIFIGMILIVGFIILLVAAHRTKKPIHITEA